MFDVSCVSDLVMTQWEICRRWAQSGGLLGAIAATIVWVLGGSCAWTQTSPPASGAASRSATAEQKARWLGLLPDDGDIPWLTVEGSEPWPESTLVGENLPHPPEALEALIDTGQVGFRFYDPEKLSRRFAGETRMAMVYRLEYTFRSRLIRAGGKRRLQVKVEHRPTEFTRVHQILLPIAHANQGMYEVPLVLHELDHVRIGVDPRYPALFDEWLQETTKTLTFDWNAEARESDIEGWVQREMDQQAKASFARLMQLMEVRQRELDRVTRHGLLPLPSDFFGDPEQNPTSDRAASPPKSAGKRP